MAIRADVSAQNSMPAIDTSVSAWNLRDGSAGAYVPNLFSQMLLKEYYEKDILTAVTNNMADSSGIKNQGDKVTFRGLPDIAINDITVMGETAWEYLTGKSIDMSVDKAKYFAFVLDDIDTHQADLILSPKFIEHARKTMSTAICKQFLVDMKLKGEATTNRGIAAGKYSESINLGVTAIANGTGPRNVTKSNVLDYFADIKLVLSEQDAITGDSFVIVPPSVASLLDRSAIIDASYAGMDKSLALTAGYLGNVAGLNLFTTNNCNIYENSADTAFNEIDIFFGNMDAVCYVNQITKSQVIDTFEDNFAKGFRSLTVYDWKVIHPQACGSSVIYL